MNRNMKALVWAMDATDLSAGQFRLLVCLARRVNETNFDVWPSHKRLSTDAEMSVSAARRGIIELEEKGFIKKNPRFTQNGDQTSNVYTLQVDVTVRLPSDKTTKVSPSDDYGDGEKPPVQIEHPPLSSGEHPPLFTNDQTPLFTNEHPPLFAGEHQTTQFPNDLRLNENSLLLTQEAVSLEKNIFDQIREDWTCLKSQFPKLGDFRQLDAGFRTIIENRLKQHRENGQTEFEVWNRVILNIRISPFLTGRVPPGRDNRTSFKLTLPKLFRAEFFRNVIWGAYNDQSNSGSDFQFDSEGNRRSTTDQAIYASIKGV